MVTMIRRNDISGVEFLVSNTDLQALSATPCQNRIQLGVQTTKGFGSGSKPDVGKASAEEALDNVLDRIGHLNMLFITAGMGGGTGTGAAPVIAKAAKERGILTVAMVTMPFRFEGSTRMKQAMEGISELEKCVDTLISIPNENLLGMESTLSVSDAFSLADNVVCDGVKAIVDLITIPGIINLDFADVKTVMRNSGKALMGTGVGEGADRASTAVRAALNNPLLGFNTIRGAKNVLLNVCGDRNLLLVEVEKIASAVREQIVEDDVSLILGASFDDALQQQVRVSVVVTGLQTELNLSERGKKVAASGSTSSSSTNSPQSAQSDEKESPQQQQQQQPPPAAVAKQEENKKEISTGSESLWKRLAKHW